MISALLTKVPLPTTLVLEPEFLKPGFNQLRSQEADTLALAGNGCWNRYRYTCSSSSTASSSAPWISSALTFSSVGMDKMNSVIGSGPGLISSVLPRVSKRRSSG